MGAIKLTGAQTGTAVFADAISLSSLLITADTGIATATLKGAGNIEVKISAIAGASFEFVSISGGNQYARERIPGPVTIDITGTGNPFARVSF